MSKHDSPSTTDPSPSVSQQTPYAAFVGIDWADQKHALCLLGPDGQREESELDHCPEAITDWAKMLHNRFGGQPVAVAIEQARGGLIHALMQFEHLVLFPINPKQAARYREVFSVSGKKDDPADARMLARLLREHHLLLRAWKRDDADTVQIARLGELRRKTVELRKKTGQQLRSILKLYFHQALEIARHPHHPMTLEMLRRWPSLQKLQRAHPQTLRKFFRSYGRRNEEKVDALIAEIRQMTPLTKEAAIMEPNALFVEMLVKQLEQLNQAVTRFDEHIERIFAKHEDAPLFQSLPGAGAALAPRLLAAMGSDRQRFDSAEEVQCYSGIAPVTKKSGQASLVHRRFACPKFIRQTFHEFADHARKWSDWSKAYYLHLRDKGKKHQAAVRALAFKWIRIIFRLWKDRTTYDENQYLQQLRKKNVPYLKFIQDT